MLNTAILNNHNVGIHWILVSDKTYEKLSPEQTELLEATIHEIRPENRECVDEATEEILDEYRANDAMTVIETEDIDMDAFISQSEEFFGTYFTGESARGVPGHPRDGRLTSPQRGTGWVRFRTHPVLVCPGSVDPAAADPTAQGHRRGAHRRSDAVGHDRLDRPGHGDRRDGRAAETEDGARDAGAVGRALFPLGGDPAPADLGQLAQERSRLEIVCGVRRSSPP